MNNKKIEEVKMEAGENLKNDVEIYDERMNAQHCRIICKMREIIYEQSKHIFGDAIICNSSVTPKQRLKMVVRSAVKEIAKQMHITPGDVMLFLLFDKLVYEIELERLTLESLANNKEYQELTKQMTNREKEIRRNKRASNKLKKESREIQAEIEKREKQNKK